MNDLTSLLTTLKAISIVLYVIGIALFVFSCILFKRYEIWKMFRKSGFQAVSHPGAKPVVVKPKEKKVKTEKTKKTPKAQEPAAETLNEGAEPTDVLESAMEEKPVANGEGSEPTEVLADVQVEIIHDDHDEPEDDLSTEVLSQSTEVLSDATEVLNERYKNFIITEETIMKGK